MQRHETRPVDPVLVAPLKRTGPGYWVVVAVLATMVSWGFYAWLHQFREGLGVTGMNRPIYWGLYITNFVFFIGISHAGAFISAILRIVGAGWRRPITRAAEAITVFSLVMAISQILLDMGRPDRILNVLLYGKLESPLLWDMTSVGVYFLGSVTFLYLPLIPDMAILRDQAPLGSGLRQRLYRILAFGWHGGPEQRRRLEKAMGIMAVLIIPIMVTVHTTVSWIFGLTLQPMWHSTILGPYFVIGAIYSGIATVVLVTALIRKVWHLESYLRPQHFNSLSLLLIAMSALWAYFTVAELMTTAYGNLTAEMVVFEAKWSGEFRFVFWAMAGCMALAFALLILPRLMPSRWASAVHPRRRPMGALAGVAAIILIVVPALSLQGGGFAQAGAAPRLVLLLAALALAVLFVAALAYLKGRTIAQAVVASLLVNVGMWLERFAIIVPTESRPTLLFSVGVYRPTWVEWSITVGAFAALALLYAIFVKVFPIISIWEVQEGATTAGAEVATGGE